MNKSIFTISLLLIAMLTVSIGQAQRSDMTRDSLSLSPFYANDLFYSFENGEVSSVERANWDIAFYTPRFSAGIMINDGSGAVLYTYPNGDTSAWATADTAGISGWEEMYNSPEVWEDGAFNKNALGHPDYGWGWYNMSDHHVYGDSIYIIKLTDNVYKKLWIKEKISIDNIFLFTFADLDGSNETNVELDVKPYESKNFIYYSLAENKAIDREPEEKSWDILFTKYMEVIQDDEGTDTWYTVTGVTSNVDIGANHFYPVAPNYTDWYEKPLDSIKNEIGFDWKELNFADFSWTIHDSNYYFVQNFAGDIYKLGFIWWEGSMTGNFALDKQLVSLVSVDESVIEEAEFSVYPNPATSQFTLRSSGELSGEYHINMFDQSGRVIMQRTVAARDLESGIGFNELSLTKGLYIISVSGNNYSSSHKLLVK